MTMIKTCVVCGVQFEVSGRGSVKRTTCSEAHRKKIVAARQRRYSPGYYLKNREVVRARTRDYYQNNKEKCVAQAAARKAKNLDRVRQKQSVWRKLNKEKIQQKNQKRGAAIGDLLAVLRIEMPDLLKEFGL